MTMDSETPNNPTLARLEDQIAWYDRRSSSNESRFKWLKGVTIVSALFIPVLSQAKFGEPYVVPALGIIIAIAEGLQQLNQFQANWISYRSTCEALRHEKYLYLGQAGPYASVDKPIPVLAERVEGLISQENAKWISSQDQREKKPPSGQPTVKS
jgi:hypothetical protein